MGPLAKPVGGADHGPPHPWWEAGADGLAPQPIRQLTLSLTPNPFRGRNFIIIIITEATGKRLQPECNSTRLQRHYVCLHAQHRDSTTDSSHTCCLTAPTVGLYYRLLPGIGPEYNMSQWQA